MKAKKNQKEDDRTKLILHFNVDKTILVRTHKEFYNVEYWLKSILCSQIWGKEEDIQGEKTFKRVHNDLEFEKSNIPDNGELINYLDYLNKKYKLRDIDPENQDVDKAINEDLWNKKVKAIIDVRDKNNPGFPFNKQLEDMKKKIRVDEKITQDYALKIETRNIDYKILTEKNDDIKFDFNSENAIKNNFRALFKNAYHSTIISFFNLITTLSKNKRRFVIIFHFFDMPLSCIEEFIFEFNAFCNGNHPKYNGDNGTQVLYFDGKNSKNFKDFRIKEYDSYSKSAENAAIFVRNARNPDKENLIWENLNFEQEIDEDLRDNIEECFEGGDEENNVLDKKIVKGYNQILTTMYEKLVDYSSLALIDDASLYNKTKKNGKLIIIDPYDYETQHILFDSDLENDLEKVDFIDIATGKKLDNQKCLNKFLVNVDPRKAITDFNYFVSKVDFCEKNRENELKVLKMKEFPYIPDFADFDLKKEIHELSCDTYLEMSIFSLLQRVSHYKFFININLKGFNYLDTFRPNDSITFLANFMLKNKHTVKNLEEYLISHKTSREGKHETIYIDDYDEKGNVIDENKGHN